ncbi:hypothetical protein ACTXT7_006931 [Hymenolepis weldensis]
MTKRKVNQFHNRDNRGYVIFHIKNTIWRFRIRVDVRNCWPVSLIGTELISESKVNAFKKIEDSDLPPKPIVNAIFCLKHPKRKPRTKKKRRFGLNIILGSGDPKNLNFDY